MEGARLGTAVAAALATGWILRDLWQRYASKREADAMQRRAHREAAISQELADGGRDGDAVIKCTRGVDRTFGISQSDTALVLIDMQTDFLHREGRLGRHYDAARHEVLAKTIKQVERLLKAARSAGLTVAHSRSHRYGAMVRRDLLEGPQPEAPTGIDESRQHFGKVDLGYELLPALRGACVAYPLLSFLFMPTSLVSWLLEQPSLARLSSTSGPLARSRRPTSRSAFVSAVSVRYYSAAYSQMCASSRRPSKRAIGSSACA